MTLFSKNIRYLRLLHDLTQDQLAEILSLDRSTYTYYENGHTQPKLYAALKLAQYFRVSLDKMLTCDLSQIPLRNRRNKNNHPS